MARLHPDEIDHYQREGWVIPRWQLPAAQVATMVQALEQLAANLKDLAGRTGERARKVGPS